MSLMNTKLTNALSELSAALGGGYARGEYWDHECVLEAMRRLMRNGVLTMNCPACGSSKRDLRLEVSELRRSLRIECPHPWHKPIPSKLAAKALGAVKSERKAASSANNGKLGGRPRKPRQP